MSATDDSSESDVDDSRPLSDYELALQLQNEWDAEDAAQAPQPPVAPAGPATPAAKAKKEEVVIVLDSDEEDDDVEVLSSVPATKRPGTENDEALARRLQEEWSPGPAQPKARPSGNLNNAVWLNTSLQDADCDPAAGFVGLESKVSSCIPASAALSDLLSAFSEDFSCPNPECAGSCEPFGLVDAALSPDDVPCGEFLRFLEHACSQGKCGTCDARFCIACRQLLESAEAGGDESSRSWSDHCSLLRLLLTYAALAKLAKRVAENEEEEETAAKRPRLEPAPQPARGRGRGRRGRGGRYGASPMTNGAGTGYAYGGHSHFYGQAAPSNGSVSSALNEQLTRQHKMDDDLVNLFDSLIFLLPDSSLRFATPDLFPHELLPSLLRKSSLIDVLAGLLRNDSFLEITGASDGYVPPPRRYSYGYQDYAMMAMGLGGFPGEDGGAENAGAPPAVPTIAAAKGRSAVYIKGLELIRALVDGHEILASVVIQGYDAVPSQTPSKGRKRGRGDGQNAESEHVPSILEMLTGLLKQADVFVASIAKTANDDMLEEERSAAALGLALELKAAGERITASAKRMGLQAQVGSSTQMAGGAGNSSVKDSSSSGYADLLKEHVFGEVDLKIVESKHPGAAAAAYSNVAPNRGRTLRINQEAATLSTSLPAPEPSSSIFLRVDDNSFDKWRFIITGPAEDTPYAYGCFLFDTSFGAGYPHEPPSVRILTTGKGTCRFNPNLYADGKVCLSLLNTWQGSPEEMWQPNKSTISQVLLSIQTFILVPQPYFNEPGYGPPNPKNPQSIAYNKVVRRNTVRLAMVDMLRNPPAGFEDVVRRHFWWLHNGAPAKVEGSPSQSSKGKGKPTPVTKSGSRVLDLVRGWAREDRDWDGTNRPEYQPIYYASKGKNKSLVAPAAATAAAPVEGEFAEFGAGWSKLLTELKTELDRLEAPNVVVVDS